MKPKILCRAFADLFFDFEDRIDAAKLCAQCPSKKKCYEQAVREKAQSQMRGGAWFSTTSNPIPVELPTPPVPVLVRGRRTNYMDVYVRSMAPLPPPEQPEPEPEPEVEPGFRAQHGPLDRHGYWRRGPICQTMSNRAGIPCREYICRQVYGAYRKDRKRRKRDGAAAA